MRACNGLANPLILDKADRLRMIRNPFVHLKEFDHQPAVGQRMTNTRTFDIPALPKNSPWTPPTCSQSSMRVDKILVRRTSESLPPLMADWTISKHLRA